MVPLIFFLRIRSSNRFLCSLPASPVPRAIAILGLEYRIKAPKTQPCRGFFGVRQSTLDLRENMNTTSQIQSAAIQLKVSTGIAPNDAPFSGQTLALDPDNVTTVQAKSYQHFRLEQNGQVIENPNLDERGNGRH